MGMDSAPVSLDGLNTGLALSELERSIVRLLQVDGRAQHTQMARVLGVTVKTVARKVERLLDEHVIEITTATNPSLLGYRAGAFVGIQCDGSRPLDQIVAELAKLPSGDYAVQTTGRFALLFETLCRDAAEMLDVAHRQVLTISGISGIEVFPFLRMPYQEPTWDEAQVKHGRGLTAAEAPELDDADRRIIAELSNNGRLPFATVGETLGLSESQVRKRVHRMTSTGAVRIMALTNPRGLGFETLAFVAICAAPSQSVTELADTIAALPSVAYLAICAGRYDMFAEVVCRDREHLMTVLDTEFRTLPGVTRLETMISTVVHYRRLIPAVPIEP
jgi:Lrp/AsnC family transcriptional regulator for asnA, asnC and gidA